MVLHDLETSFSELLEAIKRVEHPDIGQVISQFISRHPMLFSTRTKCRIENMERLLHELEKRDLISMTTVEKGTFLDEIVSSLNCDKLVNSLVRYRQILRDSRKMLQQPICIPQNEQQQAEQHTPAQWQEGGLPPQVKELIREKIGRKWFDLARHLSIRDAELDDIEDRYKDNARRVGKMLEVFEKNTPPAMQTVKLVNALNKAKRRDLAEELESMLLHDRM